VIVKDRCLQLFFEDYQHGEIIGTGRILGPNKRTIAVLRDIANREKGQPAAPFLLVKFLGVQDRPRLCLQCGHIIVEIRT